MIPTEEDYCLARYNGILKISLGGRRSWNPRLAMRARLRSCMAEHLAVSMHHTGEIHSLTLYSEQLLNETNITQRK